MEYRKINEKRRSVNFFDPDVKITKKDIKAIYDVARLAPSSFNMQPYKIMVALSDEMKEKLLPAANKQPKVKDASATLAFFGYKKTYKHWDDILEDWKEKGYVYEDGVDTYKNMAVQLYQDHEEEFVARNVGILAMNFMLAAKEQGWDTHPMDGMDPEAVRKVFGLDRDFLAVMLLTIGKKKPDAKLLPRGMRRDFEEVFEIR